MGDEILNNTILKNINKKVKFLPDNQYGTIDQSKNIEPLKKSVNSTSFGMAHDNLNLQDDYSKKKNNMENKLEQEIQKHLFVKDAIKVPKKQIIQKKDSVALLEEKLKEDIRIKNQH